MTKPLTRDNPPRVGDSAARGRGDLSIDKRSDETKKRDDDAFTGLTRSKTAGAHKELASLQATTGEAQCAAINTALAWCTDHGYTRRSS